MCEVRKVCGHTSRTSVASAGRPLCKVYAQRAASHLGAVEVAIGALGCCAVVEFAKAIALGLAGVAVYHNPEWCGCGMAPWLHATHRKLLTGPTVSMSSPSWRSVTSYAMFPTVVEQCCHPLSFQSWHWHNPDAQNTVLMSLVRPAML